MAIVASGSREDGAKEFLFLAAEIVRSDTSNEGALRTAISRAYYAVFLTVRDRLFGPDASRLKHKVRQSLDKEYGQRNPGKSPGSHERIIFAITELKPSGHLNPVVLSQQLGQLKEARTRADYLLTKERLKDVECDTWR